MRAQDFVVRAPDSVTMLPQDFETAADSLHAAHRAGVRARPEIACISELRYLAQCDLRSGARDDDRWPRSLHRERIDARVRGGKRLSCEGERFRSIYPFDDMDILFERALPFRDRRQRHSQPREFRCVPPDSKSDERPARAQLVEIGNLPCEHHRMPVVDAVDDRAKLDPARRLRKRSQMHEGLRRVAGMIADAECVETNFLCEETSAHDHPIGIGIVRGGAALDGKPDSVLVALHPGMFAHIPPPSRSSDRSSRTNSRNSSGPRR